MANLIITNGQLAGSGGISSVSASAGATIHVEADADDAARAGGRGQYFVRWQCSAGNMAIPEAPETDYTVPKGFRSTDDIYITAVFSDDEPEEDEEEENSESVVIRFIRNHWRWLAMAIAMVVALIAGSEIGKAMSSGALGEVASSEAAFKTLTPEAYDILNTAGIYAKWNEYITALLWIVGAIMALRTLSKGVPQILAGFGYIATIAAVSIEFFAVKNVLIALYNGLSINLLPMPLIFGIVIVAIVAVIAARAARK
ncbi:MAG: hypothetical protein LBK50_00860 [Candidatus Nomurabacteria bacterium]|jgi:hypothetical protein|nr:hypothetical protein [Candidatus Nomurabacteria bacterium]